MANDRYVRFDRKQDNSGQIIAADDINSLQTVSETTQKEVFRARDRSFLDRCLFTLEHHRTMNGMWIDLFETTAKIDISKTKNLIFSEAEQAVVFPENVAEAEGWLYSTTWTNSNASLMKKVIVMYEATIPENTDLVIEISNDGANWFTPSFNASEPFEIPTDGNKLKLRARYIRSVDDATPRLEGWGILFLDPANNIVRMPDGTPINTGPGTENPTIQLYHNQLLGIGTDDHHPMEHTHDGTDGSGLISHASLTDIGEDDHHDKNHQHGTDGVDAVNLQTDVVGTLPTNNLSYQVWLGRPGQTGMYFDPKLGDRLTYVKTPDDETYLFYDLKNEGRLDHSITIRQGVAAWETLIYGPYTNSQGEVTTVMLGTDKSEYDATDLIIRTEIEKLIAPDQVKGIAVSDPKLGGTLDVTWVANTETDLAGYHVYVSSNGGTTWVQANSTIITAVTFSVSGLIDGQTYHFKVVAEDTTGYISIDSAIVYGIPTLLDTIAPAKPMSMSAAGGGGTVNLAWAPNTEPDLAVYNVYRSPTGLAGSFLKIGTINQPITSYADTGGIVTGSQYYYYVTASDTTGNESVASDIVVATA